MKEWDQLVSGSEIRKSFLLYGNIDDVYPCEESAVHPCGEHGLLSLDQCINELFGRNHIVIFFDVSRGIFENKSSGSQEREFRELLRNVGLSDSLKIQFQENLEERRERISEFFSAIVENTFKNVVLVIRESIRLMNEKSIDFDSLNASIAAAPMGNTVLFETRQKKDLPEALLNRLQEEQMIELIDPDEEVRYNIMTDPTYCYFWTKHQREYEKEFLDRNLKRAVYAADGMTSREIIRAGISMTEHEIPIQRAESYIEGLRKGPEPDPWKKLDLRHVQEILQKRLRGKDRMIEGILTTLRHAGQESFLPDRKSPRLVLSLVGATGTGKTETAKALAEGIFGNSRKLTRFDCANMKDEASVNAFLGAPRGYIGYEDEPEISKAIRRERYQVILFDEFDKVNPVIDDILLSLIDEGEIQLRNEQIVSLKDAIIVFTSNAGMEEVERKYGVNVSEKEIATEAENALKRRFRPEMWARWKNRVQTYVFPYLTEDDLLSIAQKFMENVQEKYLDQANIRILPAASEIVERERDHFLSLNRIEGGRAVRNIFERHMEPWISDAIRLLKKSDEKMTVKIVGFDWNAGKCILQKK